MDIFKCDLCFGHFSDSGRWPRVLGCGHSICSVCTNLLLKDGIIICPSCTTPHPAIGPQEVPLNHTVLKILNSSFAKTFSNYENSLESSQTSVALQTAGASSKVPLVAAEPSHHAGICDEHGQYLMFWCARCMEWICRDCTVVNHPHSVCPIASIRQAIREMQQSEDRLIKNTVAMFDENLQLFRCKHQTVKAIRDQHAKQVKELQEIIAVHRMAERVLEKEDSALRVTMSKGLGICFTLLESQGNLLGASSLLEMQESRRKAQECQSAVLGWFNPSLLDESTDLLVSQEILKATAAALATMRQAIAMAGCSVTLVDVKQSAPLLSESALASPQTIVQEIAQGIQKEMSDLEELLCSSTSENPEGWAVLSPSVVHSQKVAQVQGSTRVKSSQAEAHEQATDQISVSKDVEATQKPDQKREKKTTKTIYQDITDATRSTEDKLMTIPEADTSVATSSECDNSNIRSPQERDIALAELKDTLQIIQDREEVYAESQKILHLANTGQLTSPTYKQEAKYHTQIDGKDVERTAAEEAKDQVKIKNEEIIENYIKNIADATENTIGPQNVERSTSVVSERESSLEIMPPFAEVVSQISEPSNVEEPVQESNPGEVALTQEDNKEDCDVPGVSITGACQENLSPTTKCYSAEKVVPNSPETHTVDNKEVRADGDLICKNVENPDVASAGQAEEQDTGNSLQSHNDNFRRLETKENTAVISLAKDEGIDETTVLKTDEESARPTRQVLANITKNPPVEIATTETSLAATSEVENANDHEEHVEDLNTKDAEKTMDNMEDSQQETDKAKSNERCKTQ